jgi:hypothetical protein
METFIYVFWLIYMYIYIHTSIYIYYIYIHIHMVRLRSSHDSWRQVRKFRKFKPLGRKAPCDKHHIRFLRSLLSWLQWKPEESCPWNARVKMTIRTNTIRTSFQKTVEKIKVKYGQIIGRRRNSTLQHIRIKGSLKAPGSPGLWQMQIKGSRNACIALDRSRLS